MKEYITRREALIVLEEMEDIESGFAAMYEIPTADVAEVRHGRWEKQSGLYSCSECGMTCPYDVQADVIEYWACNYCPSCGAKIDKEEE